MGDAEREEMQILCGEGMEYWSNLEFIFAPIVILEQGDLPGSDVDFVDLLQKFRLQA